MDRNRFFSLDSCDRRNVMSQNSRFFVIPMITCLVFGFSLLVGTLDNAVAQEGSLYVRAKHKEGADELPVMINAIRDGEVIRQEEVVLWSTNDQLVLFRTPAGLYDVRVEGEGVITEVKQGIHVFPKGEGDTSLHFIMRPGQGVHIVEYATGGLSREEIATRLARLEAVVSQLQEE
jgi:hypothetical protein